MSGCFSAVLVSVSGFLVVMKAADVAAGGQSGDAYLVMTCCYGVRELVHPADKGLVDTLPS